VSNPVPVNKKQGMIRLCTNLHDLNKACPKDNFPTPFIDQIINECAGCEAFSFMDGFSGYNQIQIQPEDQHWEKRFTEEYGIFGAEPTRDFFMDAVKEQYHPVGNYHD
jgi:hypothetical protein